MKHWLACRQCRVGVSNRMVRFLAGLGTTGEPFAGEHLAGEPAAEAGGEGAGWAPMLAAARENLRRCAFIGVMERYDESMEVLKQTFPVGLRSMQGYTRSDHAKGAGSVCAFQIPRILAKRFCIRLSNAPTFSG